jgi:signal transduction histidine kinase
VRGPRSLRGRIALSFAAAVFCAAVLYAALAIGVFLLHEQAEAEEAAAQGVHDPDEAAEHLAVVLTMAAGIGVVAPIAAAFAWGVGLWLANQALAPLREAADRAEAARAGTRELLLPVSGADDEWDQLAVVVNELLAEERRAMARARTFSANAAHELRTPLTAMLGEMQVTLRRERTPAEYRAALGGVEAEVTRLTRLVERLLVLARADSGALRARPEPFDLAQVAADAASAAARDRRGAPIRVEGGPVPVLGDPLLSQQVLANLVENAVHHGGPNVLVRVTREGSHGAAAVVDDGPGVPLAVQDRLFERFNRVAQGGDGFGLGLAIAHALSLAQGGRLRLLDGAPTRFVLELPAADRERAA